MVAWILVALLLLLNAAVLVLMGSALRVAKQALLQREGEAAKASAWRKTSHEILALLRARDTVEAMVETDLDWTAVHPDPADQAEANRMITELKGHVEMIRRARGVEVKGSKAPN